MSVAVDMRRDSVVAGQVMGPSSLSLRGGPDRRCQVELHLEPSGDGVAVTMDSEASHLLGDPLPALVRAQISCALSNELLRALRQMCVADRVAGRRRGGLAVSWQLLLSGGSWEVGFSESEEHPPLDRALEAIRSLASAASHAPGAEVRWDSLPPERAGHPWLARLAVVAALTLAAVAMVLLSGCAGGDESAEAAVPPPAFWGEGLEPGVNWGPRRRGLRGHLISASMPA